MSVIEIEDLTKDYGNGKGVFHVDLNVEEGEVFGYLGPNGAGKSTTIRHLMGFSKPDSGFTRIYGKNTFDNYYQLLQYVGYLPGEIALPKGLTGDEFIEMMQNLRHMKDRGKANELIDMFELDNLGETRSMSLGQKRKLAIVAAFMHDPAILVLDEPTSGLDPIMQKRFTNFVVDEKKRGKTILLSSHIFSEVDATCDRIATIKDGVIVDRFNTDEFKHSRNKKYTITFKENETAKLQQDFISIVQLSEDGKNVELVIDESDTNRLFDLLKDAEVTDMQENVISLKDHFMSFYKEDREFMEVF